MLGLVKASQQAVVIVGMKFLGLMAHNYPALEGIKNTFALNALLTIKASY
jgi:hypothetical protein